MFTKAHLFIHHNRICIFISKLIKWDNLKSFVNNCFLAISMKKRKYIFSSAYFKPLMYLPNYKIDEIQKIICHTKNYYDYDALNFICFNWENGKISKKLRTGTTLDVGANIGNHSLFFLLECHAQEVYAFEPVPSTFSILEKNIKLNHLENKTHLLNVAIGEKESRASLSFFDKKNIGMAQIEEDSQGEFPLISIDSLNLQNLIFVKIDVEGFELNVIKGMQETLKKHKPYIMIEIRHNKIYQIDEILKAISYEYIELNQNTEVSNRLYFCKE